MTSPRSYAKGSRADIAWRLRRTASRIWDHWELDKVRYLSEADLIVIQIVGKIDGLANRLDPPY